jgi:hypothetical protein
MDRVSCQVGNKLWYQSVLQLASIFKALMQYQHRKCRVKSWHYKCDVLSVMYLHLSMPASVHCTGLNSSHAASFGVPYGCECIESIINLKSFRPGQCLERFSTEVCMALAG